mgnify:FL=1
MKTVTYVYRTFDLGCGCCSDSENYLEIRDESGCQEIHCWQLISNEQELIQYLKEEHPQYLDYDIDDVNSWWF